MINFSQKDKIALITGTSKATGEAIALALADYGTHCILVDKFIPRHCREDKVKWLQRGGICLSYGLSGAERGTFQGGRRQVLED